MRPLNTASKYAIVFAVIVVVLAVAAVVAYFVTQGTGDGSVPSGGACSANSDCQGFAFAQPGAMACCNKTCQKLYADWAGIGMCGADCKSGLLEAKGTCYPNPRQLGEPCDVVTAPCDGKLGSAGQLYCCGGTCKAQVPNVIGIGICPSA
jgi:hypothetical protein